MTKVLEVAIGLILVFLVASLICSGINELIASALKKRGKILYKGINSLLGNEFAGKLYQHGLVTSLEKKSRKKKQISYLPASLFSLALIDILRESGEIEQGIKNVANDSTKESLQALFEKSKWDTAASPGATLAQRQLATFQKNVEDWYRDAMDRVSGWYKRWTQFWIVIIAVILVGLVNLDSYMLVKRFSEDDALRAAAVTAAQQTVQNSQNNTANTEQSVVDASKVAQTVSLPIGWSNDEQDPLKVPNSVWGWLIKFAGMAATIAAISMGAPFWFDMLSKFVNVRGSGNPPNNGNTQGTPTAPQSQEQG